MAVAATSLLVIRRGGFGDTLLLAPLLRALRRRWPAAALEVAGVAEFTAVLVALGLADAASSSETVLARWRRRDPAAPGWATVLADGAWPELVAAGLGVRTFEPRQPAPGVPFGRQLAERAGLEVEWPADARPVGVGGGNGPWLLAPGSGGRAKCWPAAGWCALAAALAADGAAVRVLVGPTEIERDDPRRWPWPVPVAFVADRTPVELVAELRTACGFVGNDAGPSHLAALLGLPTVVVFGPSDPAVWAPVGRHVQVVAGGADFAAATVPLVVAATRRGVGSA